MREHPMDKSRPMRGLQMLAVWLALTALAWLPVILLAWGAMALWRWLGTVW